MYWFPLLLGTWIKNRFKRKIEVCHSRGWWAHEKWVLKSSWICTHVSHRRLKERWGYPRKVWHAEGSSFMILSPPPAIECCFLPSWVWRILSSCSWPRAHLCSDGFRKSVWLICNQREGIRICVCLGDTGRISAGYWNDVFTTKKQKGRDEGEIRHLQILPKKYIF